MIVWSVNCHVRSLVLLAVLICVLYHVTKVSSQLGIRNTNLIMSEKLYVLLESFNDNYVTPVTRKNMRLILWSPSATLQVAFSSINKNFINQCNYNLYYKLLYITHSLSAYRYQK